MFSSFHTSVAEPNVARLRSDSYFRDLVFTKMESVNMFTSSVNVKVFILESYVPLRLSMIWPSLSRIAPPLWNIATESLVL